MALSSTFVRCCLLTLHTKSIDDRRISQLARVIDTLDLSPSNLAVALLYLHKYQHNSVLRLDVADDALHYYTIIASLILANKFINDQSYTLKTWHSILAKCSDFRPALALLNQLEQNFLAALDFGLSTSHDARLWAAFSALDPRHVASLRSAVASPHAPSCCGAKPATPPSAHYGLATPPSAFTVHASPLSYTGCVSPTPAAFTPLAAARGEPAMPAKFLHTYPSPVLHTPQRGARDGLHRKRRKMDHRSCGTGFAFEPAHTVCYNV